MASASGTPPRAVGPCSSDAARRGASAWRFRRARSRNRLVRVERFPKSLRLRTRTEFLRVQEGGRKIEAGPFLALVRKNELGWTRLGITVSKKVGSAVTRVRIRRRLRELFRRNRAALPSGLDMVLVARTSAKEASFARLQDAFGRVVRALRGELS